MTGQSIPRIGRNNAKNALNRIVKIVNFREPISEDELVETMEDYNQNNETKIFQNPSELVLFTRDDKSSSIQILSTTPDGYVLNDTGKRILEAENDEKELFEILVEKSQTEFVYFWEVIRNLDQMNDEGNYTMSTSLMESILDLMDSGHNKVTAGTIGGLLQDFQLIEKDDNGVWCLNPDQYAYLRGGKQDVLVEVLESQENMRIDRSDLEEMMRTEYNWTSAELEDIIVALKSQGQVQTDRYEGKQVIERVTY